MVGLTGFEPVTSRLSGGRSNQLSYRPAGAGRVNEYSASTSLIPIATVNAATEVETSVLLGVSNRRQPSRWTDGRKSGPQHLCSRSYARHRVVPPSG